MAFQLQRRRRILAEINVTPLTDVFLVLLIIFMVTTSALVQSMADVHLPKAKADDDTAAAVTVSLAGDRRISVGGRTVGTSDAQVVAALRDALATSTSKNVVLAGDEQASLSDVVRLLGLAKQAGASGFALATEGK
ncbi:MAG TPA: biopolymer transporter ExbD [Candidatus Bathyarchaeia archaeon]|nr:biopolymer transporter ExbD [Candidatus Bathyarchaeia archaeon]